jgi:hypothetical protein
VEIELPAASTVEVVEVPVVEVPVFDPPNILWYLGAFIATGAALTVIDSIHESARGTWVLLVSLGFLAAWVALARTYRRRDWTIPAGVFAATAIAFVATAAVAFERLIGVWGTSHPIANEGLDVAPDTSFGLPLPAVPHPSSSFSGSHFSIALIVLVAALVARRRSGFAFCLVWASVAIVAAAVLLVTAFTSSQGFEPSAWALVAGSGLLLLLGLGADRRDARRDGFWWHLVGLGSLAIALAYLFAIHHAIWPTLVVGIVGLAGAARLQRATWALFGLTFLNVALGHYVERWTGNLGTSFVFVAIGILFVGLGIELRRSGTP